MGTYQIVMLVILVAGFYLLIIRPQQQRQKQHQDTVSALKPGATIVTIGGLVAEVVEVRGDRVLLKVADGGTMEYVKDAVGKVLPDEELTASDLAMDDEDEDADAEVQAYTDATDTTDEDEDTQ